MKRICLALLAIVVLMTAACKKSTNSDTEPVGIDKTKLSGENKLLSFEIPGQLSAATIDTGKRTISATISFAVNRAAVNVKFTVSKDATLSINDVAQVGTATANLSKTSTLKVIAANGNISTWTVTVTTDMELYGVGSNVTAWKSIEKSFEWYYDQYLTGTYWSINCGPAVTTMAAKWADSTYTKTVENARQTIRSTGGWWYTSDIVTYLNNNGVNTAYTTLPDSYQTIKKYIDKNYLVILCIDNYYLTYNANTTVRIDKFYQVSSVGSGHFIILKGYKMVDNKVYFEAYDPWSVGMKYTSDGTLKGKNRYYSSGDIEQATGQWWDYAIIVAPKGKTVVMSEGNGLKVQSQTNIPAQKGA